MVSQRYYVSVGQESQNGTKHGELSRLLPKFSYGTDEDRGLAAIMFEAQQRKIRFTVELPDQARDKSLRRKTHAATLQAVEQLHRSRWRALLLCVKAKLESVESKIETFEEAFLAHVVLPDGTTAAEWLKPQLQLAYDSGQMPRQLPALPAPEAE